MLIRENAGEAEDFAGLLWVAAGGETRPVDETKSTTRC